MKKVRVWLKIEETPYGPTIEGHYKSEAKALADCAKGVHAVYYDIPIDSIPILSKERFVEICELSLKSHENHLKTYKAGIDLTNFTDDLFKVISVFLEECLGKERAELVTDYLYGGWDGNWKSENESGKVNSFEELWEFMSENRFANKEDLQKCGAEKLLIDTCHPKMQQINGN